MTLIDSLIAALLKANGDELIMHVGERPYLLSPFGPSNLSQRELTVEAMTTILADILSADDQRTYEEFGAVVRDLDTPHVPVDVFTLVAARGGDDIWVELRRQRGKNLFGPVVPPEPVVAAPEPVVAVSEPAVAEPEPVVEVLEPVAPPALATVEHVPVEPLPAEPLAVEPLPIEPIPAAEESLPDVAEAVVWPISSEETLPTEIVDDPVSLESAVARIELSPAEPIPPTEEVVEPTVARMEVSLAESLPLELLPVEPLPIEPIQAAEVSPPEAAETVVWPISSEETFPPELAEAILPEPEPARLELTPVEPLRVEPILAAEEVLKPAASAASSESTMEEVAEALVTLERALAIAEETSAPPPEPPLLELTLPAPVASQVLPPRSAPVTPATEAEYPEPREVPRRPASARDAQPGVVLPLVASPIRPDSARPSPASSARFLGIGRLLRMATARGASSLHLMAASRPMIRVDDEIVAIEGEPLLGSAEVEALILELAQGASRETPAGTAGTEWVGDLPDVGRVRCLTFRDQRGPGAVFRLIPTRLVTADQLGLSRDIQALCGERDGLIVVTGPRLSGKSTLVSALVDVINRTRTDYVITIESEIKFLHENRKAIVSQREVRSETDAVLASARAALRENPDVLVIDDLRTPELVALALDAADTGHLVIGAVTAHTTTAAIARLIDIAPDERQTQVALGLSESLRGAIAQVLLRKSGGGRVAARELLFNMSAVAALIAEGNVRQLPLAIDSGRKYGMVPLNDALLAFVQSGAVDAREAYRKAHDRVALLEQLRREGIDTSFVERLA